MNQSSENTSRDKPLGLLRLTFLLIQLLVIMLNREDQTSTIAEIYGTKTPEIDLLQINKSFSSACTMALVFVVMQLLILYAGTNRFRVKPTIYTIILHAIGTFCYWNVNQWRYDNIWIIFSVFSFLPTISQIAVALYTAKM